MYRSMKLTYRIKNFDFSEFVTYIRNCVYLFYFIFVYLIKHGINSHFDSWNLLIHVFLADWYLVYFAVDKDMLAFVNVGEGGHPLLKLKLLQFVCLNLQNHVALNYFHLSSLHIRSHNTKAGRNHLIYDFLIFYLVVLKPIS